MSQILLTGGAGYIGSVLVGDLLNDGHHVTILDNFMYQENSLALHYANPNLHIVKGDVRNEKLLASVVPNFEWIIPLAAIVGAPACDRDEFAAKSVNVDSALALFNISDKNSKIIMPTTNSAYGTTLPGSVTSEISPLNPISHYAKHKVEVESHLLNRGNSVSLRLATVFGMSPRMRLDLLVNDLVYRALNDKSVVLFEPTFIRNFIHVRDVSKAIRHAIANWQVFNGEIFNVGLSSANISKQELCQRIKKYIPEFVSTVGEISKDPDQRNYWVSNEKIENTGFSCDYDLDFGIRELIKGIPNLRNHRYGNV